MKEEIREFISKVINTNINDIKDSSNLRDELGLDSLTILNLIGDLEDEYDFVFEESMINDMITIGDLIRYVEELS